MTEGNYKEAFERMVDQNVALSVVIANGWVSDGMPTSSADLAKFADRCESQAKQARKTIAFMKVDNGEASRVLFVTHENKTAELFPQASWTMKKVKQEIGRIMCLSDLTTHFV